MALPIQGGAITFFDTPACGENLQLEAVSVLLRDIANHKNEFDFEKKIG
jgi:hypothetical protein